MNSTVAHDPRGTASTSGRASLHHALTQSGRAAALGLASVLVTVWLTAPLGTPAGADDSLSSVVLSDTFPGYVESPSGPLNGPITANSLGGVSGVGPLIQELGGGNISAYLRTWNGPGDHDIVLIVAAQLSDPTEVTAALASLNRAAAAGTSTFAVPSIPGASGFTMQGPDNGETGTEYNITFAQGNYLFDVATVSVSGDLTEADTIALGTRQSARASTVSSTAPESLTVGLFVIGVVAVLIVVPVVLFVRRGRRHRRSGQAFSIDPGGTPPWMTPVPTPVAPEAADDHAPWLSPHARPAAPTPAVPAALPPLFATAPVAGSVTTVAPSAHEHSEPAGAYPAGWYPDYADPSLMRYFDGQEWTNLTAGQQDGPAGA
jgi:uncharacterized protein DUF2510